MKVLLISTYDLGHQPFGLASPAAWLRAAGHDVVCADLSVAKLPLEAVREAGLVAFHLPMHTATRMSVPVIERVRAINPTARLCCFGLYAPLNEAYLRKLGVHTVLGGEIESALTALASGASSPALVSLDRLQFLTPDRTGLPPLAQYSHLRLNGEGVVSGYTEASRGCKHLCRHCPVVPVYQGAFRVVQANVVLADIGAQVAAGARHISFGDPDFFNGPTHAIRIVEAFHEEYPSLTYDATIKIEHLRNHRALLPSLQRTGCLFVTSAVESVDDDVLRKLDKGHTRADFVEVVGLFRELGLTLSPTFIPFTPWTTRAGYAELLQTIAGLDLIENVSPVQLALRLLIPAGSLLLELDEIRAVIGPFDDAALLYRWSHPDPEVDALATQALKAVSAAQKRGTSRAGIFLELFNLLCGGGKFTASPSAPIPYMDEPWYCCAEPTEEQLARV